MQKNDYVGRPWCGQIDAMALMRGRVDSRARTGPSGSVDWASFPSLSRAAAAAEASQLRCVLRRCVSASASPFGEERKVGGGDGTAALAAGGLRGQQARPLDEKRRI